MSAMKNKPLPGARSDNVFFTSDTHFSHARIMDLCPETRAHADVDAMNESIIGTINAEVPADATLFHLGDVALGGWKNSVSGNVSRLNVRNRVLFPGNHDISHPLDKRHAREDVREAYSVFDNKIGNNVFWTRLPSMVNGLIPFINAENPVIGITMSHFPMTGLESDDRHHEWYMPDIGQQLHLCGHVHDRWAVNWTPDRSVLNVNVGWDAWERPLSLSEVLDIFRDFG